MNRYRTPAQIAAWRLFLATPPERITTHERRAPRPWGSHGTAEERESMREAVRRCRSLGWRKMEIARRLNLDPKTVRRWWE